jgi:hypothetical protein
MLAAMRTGGNVNGNGVLRLLRWPRLSLLPQEGLHLWPLAHSVLLQVLLLLLPLMLELSSFMLFVLLLLALL